MNGLEMEDWLFAVICSPCVFIATFLNIFFILCLRHPAAGLSLCQPLRFLLIFVICNSTIQQGTTMLIVVLTFLNTPEWLLVAGKAIVYLTYCSSFSSSAWISIFYYIKIVPHRCAVLVWIKNNIKVTVYTGFTTDQIVLLVAMSIGIVPYLHPPQPFLNSTSSPLNGTMPPGNDKFDYFLIKLCHLIFLLYLIYPLFTLTFSWTKTFFYLRGHIKRMEQGTGSSSSSQQKNQMRVTVIGIVQAALFLPSSLWILVTVLFYSTPFFDRMDGNKYITLTIISISGLANIVYLGFSQSVFRLRVTARWEGIRKTFGFLHLTDGSNI